MSDLERELNRPLAPRRNGLVLEVSDLSIRNRGGADPTLIMVVRARDDSGLAEAWEVALPIDRDLLDAGVDPTAVTRTMRANVEEWWDLKDVEAPFRAMGTRLG